MNDAAPIDLALADALAPPRTVLHVGCGPADPGKLPPAYFPADGSWRELRLDIDPDVAPDIVASLTDMGAVPDASVDAVWSAHNLEHLWAHEVPVALAEFLRVLRPGGFALVTMPDLQQVAELVAAGKLEDAAYVSPMGPIAPLDMLYGYVPALAGGDAAAAHRSGFTEQSLLAALRDAGFATVASVRRSANLEIWALASKTPRDEGAMRALAAAHLPV